MFLIIEYFNKQIIEIDIGVLQSKSTIYETLKSFYVNNVRPGKSNVV